MSGNKELRERSVFDSYRMRAKLSIGDRCIRNGDPSKSEPDIVVFGDGQPTEGYELSEICSPEIAEVVSLASESPVFAENPISRILSNKQAKIYSKDMIIHLLLYWDGRTLLPDDVVVAQLDHDLLGQTSRFASISYMGEGDLFMVYQRDA